MGSGKPDRHSGKQGRSIMSAIARRGHILLLLAVCCGVALADMHAGRSASAPESIGSTTAPLTQGTKSGDFSVPQLGGFATDLRAQNADLLGQVTVTWHGRSNFGASYSTDAELTVGEDGSPAVWIGCSPIIVGNDAFSETNRAEMVVRRRANRRVSRDHRCHQRARI